MTLRDQILEYLAAHPGATDAEIAKVFNAVHQQVNYACRKLERDGVIVRPNTDRYIRNYLIGAKSNAALTSTVQVAEKRNSEAPFDEEAIKRVLTDKLTPEGWTVSTAWSHAPGVDIDARRGSDHWMMPS